MGLLTFGAGGFIIVGLSFCPIMSLDTDVKSEKCKVKNAKPKHKIQNYRLDMD
jgi:hypothetical protein